MKFKAVVHGAEDEGYWAKAPALPGCYTEADTMEALEANLREAIAPYLTEAPSSRAGWGTT